jgi:hypothetical protein
MATSVEYGSSLLRKTLDFPAVIVRLSCAAFNPHPSPTPEEATVDMFKNLLFLHGHLLHDGDDAPVAPPAGAAAPCVADGPEAVMTTP